MPAPSPPVALLTASDLAEFGISATPEALDDYNARLAKAVSRWEENRRIKALLARHRDELGKGGDRKNAAHKLESLARKLRLALFPRDHGKYPGIQMVASRLDIVGEFDLDAIERFLLEIEKQAPAIGARMREMYGDKYHPGHPLKPETRLIEDVGRIIAWALGKKDGLPGYSTAGGKDPRLAVRILERIGVNVPEKTVARRFKALRANSQKDASKAKE